MPDTAARLRRTVGAGQRLVVKVGSSSLTSADGGHLDHGALSALVDVLATRRAQGRQVVLVSSGAIAAGIGPLGLSRRPTDLATQQAAASVGQGALVAAYQAAFSAHGLTVGQVLLTADDVTRRAHYTNARRTLERLLELGIVPIVNENDTVATQEIRFGDNDRLAALVADLVGADALVLLTDVDSLYDGPPSQGGSRRVPLVETVADLDAVRIGGTGSSVGSGGMVTKVEAAGIAGAAGIPTLLTRLADVTGALAGEDRGTVFAPAAATRASRKRWLAHATTARGRLVLDEGAVAAVTHRRKSLLPAGIVGVEGAFAAGDPVDVCDPEGAVIARGLVNYAASELPRLLGRSTRDLARDLGPEYEREVIHRDDLVVL
ncbi:MAG TPA: glutamate 5-kinase [Ornithinibacter sp.]|jgi:glutamate 5-kinase|uniref:glutamate 5-kinase n=1 Tax=Ornithinibacter sp. TaxID=2862748 RepID=UPI001B71C19D|nr:glutamate 5-kinase [Ornithinibacter sp.]MBP6523870.1 glutamate 5-kinase [Dermatophilaceae bacterium]MBU9943668.1 glutamate 5-kinase [Dermatophilaceae bacterium]HQV83287.1 glutamate 5-kinase [Ornithinibacter sp.]HQW72688.1 glutamate 5-kinase [Ornithinibacter sp.]HQX86540.1 glutamate 5-kinase [Ornithinibacter sp.]